jgi:hypothetical protein
MRLPRLTTLTCVLGIAALAALIAPLFDRALIGLAPATLLVILTTCAMPRRGGWRSGLATFGAVCGALLIPLAVSALVSKALWGYYLWPPAPDRRIVDAKLVRTAGYARTQAYLSGDVGVAFAPLGPSTKALAAAGGDPFQRQVARVLVALSGRKKLPEEPARPKPRLSMELFPLLEGSGQMYKGEGEYVNAKDLRGFVVEAEGADGTPLVFLAASGGEVSRDRHPFYEFLFKGSLESGPLELLSTRRFLFDVGSLEGFGWPELFTAAATVELLLLAAAVLTTRTRKVEPAAIAGTEAGDSPG